MILVFNCVWLINLSVLPRLVASYKPETHIWEMVGVEDQFLPLCRHALRSTKGVCSTSHSGHIATYRYPPVCLKANPPLDIHSFLGRMVNKFVWPFVWLSTNKEVDA